MCSTMNFVRRPGMIVLVMVFIMCLTMVYYQTSLAAQAKAWKPEGPLTIIVTAYGGGFDLTARQLARVLPDYLGQKVIIQAVTGGGGGNALDVVAKSKANGRTMSLTGNGPYVLLSMGKKYSWDVKELPIVQGIDIRPYAIFTSPKSPYLSYEDLVKMKKAVRIATPETNFSLIPIILDFEKKGIQYRTARFKGSGEANLAVIAGNADLTMGALSGVFMDKIYAGDFRALWVFDTKRYPLLPNVPTHFELGMPKEWANYRAMRLMQIAPGTPGYIQNGLKEALTKALKDKRTLEWSGKADVPVDIIPEKEYMERNRFVIEAFKNNPKIIETYF